MTNEYIIFLPLVLLLSTSILAIIIDALAKNRNVSFGFAIISFLSVAIAAVYTMTLPESAMMAVEAESVITKGQISTSMAQSYFDLILSIGGLMTVFASRPYLRREYVEYNEYYSMLIFAVAGMALMVHSANLLILFIGVELMSICFYVLAGFFRKVSFSIEAALKYFLLGAFSTGFLIYGISMIYGGTSSLAYNEIAAFLLSGKTISLYVTIGFALLITGLSFKTAAFPFHSWAPDVYHGSPTVVSGFLSTTGKVAAFAAFIFILQALLPHSGSHFLHQNSETVRIVIAVISALTMLVGNITALAQRNVKRMLAYSSVAHAGYMMIGIACNNADGYQGILFYTTAYMFMQIGAFTMVSTVERNSDKYLALNEWAGLSRKLPVHAAMMSVFLFSLAGLPPFAGFMGKYYLFAAAVKSDMLWLAIIGIISSILSMYFYIGLIMYMYFKEPAENADAQADTGFAWITLIICLLATMIFGLFPSILPVMF